MIKRDAAVILKKLSQGFPVVAITGPRQSGKTTLAKKVFPKKKYVTLEDLEQRSFASEDPKGFLATLPKGAVIDEAQRCPELFSAIQVRVDEKREMGQFILTGSQQFGLLSKITQSLAGRVGTLQLLPLSIQELKNGKIPLKSLHETLWRGFYPALFDRPLSPQQWYANYLKTYIERDVRQIAEIRNLSLFQRFIKMCAARNGQLLNTTELGNSCGVSHVTVRQWLSILEASYIVFFLQPHHKNFGKRLTKHPKLYFYDSGLVSHLLQIQTPEQLAIHPARGALFESLVIAEFLKQRFNIGLDSHLYFWRDNTGNEIDVVVEKSQSLIPIEIKSGQTLSAGWLASLHKWRELVKENCDTPHLIYGGNENRHQQGVQIHSWRSLPHIE